MVCALALAVRRCWIEASTRLRRRLRVSVILGSSAPRRGRPGGDRRPVSGIRGQNDAFSPAAPAGAETSPGVTVQPQMVTLDDAAAQSPALAAATGAA